MYRMPPRVPRPMVSASQSQGLLLTGPKAACCIHATCWLLNRQSGSSTSQRCWPSGRPLASMSAFTRSWASAKVSFRAPVAAKVVAKVSPNSPFSSAAAIRLARCRSDSKGCTSISRSMR